MSKKLLFLISFVLVLSLAGNVLAYEILGWDNEKGGGDRLWQTATNWKIVQSGPAVRRVPIASDFVTIDNVADADNGPIIDANTIAVGEWIDVGGLKSPQGEAVLTMTGGTVTAGTWFELGGYYSGTYRFDMSGGTIKAGIYGVYFAYADGAYVTVNMSGGTIDANWITIGWYDGSNGTFNISDGNIIVLNEFDIGTNETEQAILNMTGGDVDVNWLAIGPYDACTGTGHVDLHGGTLEADYLSMGGGGPGTLDFTEEGTLIIDQDLRVPNNWIIDPCNDEPDGAVWTGTIAILAAERGLITAYNTKVGDIITDSNYPTKVGLRAAIYPDYDLTYSGKTTITGGAVDPNLAWDPGPLNFSGEHMKGDVNLSWVVGDNAASHDVYFGTSFANVSDANIDVNFGVYEGNQPLSDVNYTVSVVWDTTYFWRIDEVNDPNTWKGRVWTFVTDKAWAKLPRPTGTSVSPLLPVLRWDPGPEANDVNGHYVYFSTDFNDVNERDPNFLILRDPNNYAPGDLELNTRYYWAVDEVNNNEDPNIWPSPNWNFKTAKHLTPDNFNPYANNAAIQAVWRKETDADADAVIKVATTPAIDGNSMMYAYRNALTSGAEANAVTTDLFAGTDWTFGGVEALVLNFYGRAGNGQEMHVHAHSADYTVDNDQMYVALEDGDANVGIVKYYDKVEGYDMNDIQEAWWHQWNIDLADPCLSAVDMANVVKIYIGFGGAKTGQSVNGVGWKSGHYDTVWFDDIQLWPPRCLSVKVEHDIAGGDCITDYNDVDIMARDWLMYDYNVAAVPITSGPNLIGCWQLDEGRQTTAVDSSIYGNDGTIYNYDWVDGYPNDPNNSALHFDGDGLATYDRVECAVRTGDGNQPNDYPAELMPATFTVACWVKVDNFGSYDGLVVNGDNYTETGWNASGFYLYAGGTSQFGLGIRTEPNMSFVETANIYNKDTWYHLAATYTDANTAHVYVDGKLAAGPTKVGGPIRWLSYDGLFPKYFLIGALYNPDVPDWWRAEATIDDVQVYDYAMSYGQIVKLAEQGPVVYHDLISPANIYDLEAKLSKIVNFRDYRMLADHWLDDPTLWP